MAGEPKNGNGNGNAKGTLRIKVLSVVVAALVWYVISSNIHIPIISGVQPAAPTNEKSLTNQAAQDENSTDNQ